MAKLVIKNGQFPPLTKEEEAELEAAKKLPFMYDEECPPQTTEELRQFQRVYPQRQIG